MPHRILIVDDDILVLEALQELFTSSECEVRVATRGQEALEILDQEHFDLLILDVVMPKMTGFDLAREVRKRDDGSKNWSRRLWRIRRSNKTG